MTQEKTPASRQALKEGGQLWQADLLIEQKYPRQRKHWTDSKWKLQESLVSRYPMAITETEPLLRMVLSAAIWSRK